MLVHVQAQIDEVAGPGGTRSRAPPLLKRGRWRSVHSAAYLHTLALMVRPASKTSDVPALVAVFVAMRSTPRMLRSTSSRRRRSFGLSERVSA